MQRRLLEWYDRNARRFPWRRAREPWPVLLSEVMLQQTRAEVVARRFEPMLERFPSPEAMAAASQEEVLAAWSGLGYYQRARRLHRAAVEIVEEGWPQDREGLRGLPGVGRYTAAAVASIAFGEACAAVDGNVERVVARLEGAELGRGSSALKRLAEERATSLLDARRPGDSNQALMELGARICRPRSPRCRICLLAAECHARRTGEPERYPLPRHERPVEEQRLTAVLVRRDGATLLFRRPDDSKLLAGLWEVPTVELSQEFAVPDLLAERYGGEWTVGEKRLATLNHTITYRRLSVEVRAGETVVDEEVADRREAGWFEIESAGALAISALTRKVIAVGREPILDSDRVS